MKLGVILAAGILAPTAFVPAAATPAQTTPAAPVASDGVPAWIESARAAFLVLDRRGWSGARPLIERIDDPLFRKVAAWSRLRRSRSGATLGEFIAFAKANPDWPRDEAFRRQAESAIGRRTPDAQIIAWFEANRPATFRGWLYYLDALRRQGRSHDATILARKLWVAETFRAVDARVFYRKFKRLLRTREHEARVDALLWKGHVNTARRTLRTLTFPRAFRRLAEARLLLMSRRSAGRLGQRRVAHALARVPARYRDDPGLVYDRIRWHRRNDRDDAARDLLLTAPDDPGHADRWWRERHIQIRRRLAKGDAATAYRLAHTHRQHAGRTYLEAEWTAGWIALRLLGRPNDAFDHFVRVLTRAKRPISRARGAYWLGRAAEARGSHSHALHWYAEAAEYPTTFYGQLAAARLGRTRVALPREPVPTEEERAAFAKNELVRAARLLYRLGRRDALAPFLSRLAAGSSTPQRWVLVADLAMELEQATVAIRAGKRAVRAGYVLVGAAYPTVPVAAADGTELPLLLSIIRQESEFDPRATSPRGARGLMQLMPRTARREARSLRLPFSRRRLLRDAAYNVTLGSAHFAKLLKRYGGSYVLAVAAYNAGPERVDEWLATFGDPRAPEIDAVDWIESIPFGETRNYVQRVLESLQTYRAQFGDSRLAAAAIDYRWRPPARVPAVEDNARCVQGTYVSDAPPPC